MPDSDASVSSMASLYKSPETRSNTDYLHPVVINGRFANARMVALMPGASSRCKNTYSYDYYLFMLMCMHVG